MIKKVRKRPNYRRPTKLTPQENKKKQLMDKSLFKIQQERIKIRQHFQSHLQQKIDQQFCKQ